jgi:hypothetical protein
MLIHRLIWLAALAAPVLSSAPLSAQTPATSPPFVITGVRAKLFFPQTGTFSDDMLAAPDLGLWNTIIGAGWAKQPSNATLVLVDVASDGHTSPRGMSVELTVTAAEGGAVILRRRVSLSSNRTGHRQEGFWIYDTGCVPLVLRARLIGQLSAAPPVERKIPFECGE